MLPCYQFLHKKHQKWEYFIKDPKIRLEFAERLLCKWPSIASIRTHAEIFCLWAFFVSKTEVRKRKKIYWAILCHCKNRWPYDCYIYEYKLRALNKSQLTELFRKRQEHTKGIINSLTKEMKNLNEKFKKLEWNVAVIMPSKMLITFCVNRWCLSRDNAGKMPSTLNVSLLK